MNRSVNFLVVDREVVIQPADEPELGGNGAVFLKPVESGQWTATLEVVDTETTYGFVYALSDSAGSAKPTWTPLSELPMSDVNVLCLVSRSRYPSPDKHDMWWQAIVDDMEESEIVSVDGGFAFRGTDGQLYAASIWQVDEKLVGVQFEIPQG